MYEDLADLIVADPIHDADDERGWPRLSKGRLTDRGCILLTTRRITPARIKSADLPRFLANLFDCFDEAFARAEREVASSLGGCQFVCRTDTAVYSGIVRRGLADVGHNTRGRDCLILAGTAATLGLAQAPCLGRALLP